MRRNWLLISEYCLLIFLAACAPATIVPTEMPIPTPMDTPTVTPAPPLGDIYNPILLALPPSQFMNTTAVANGQELATLIEDQTGYRVVAVAPTTYEELIGALKSGNAHIAVLPMFAIVKAYQENAVQAMYASSQDDVLSYGAQFIARSDWFTAYFDTSQQKNTADAPQALGQFSGKKPCWTEPASPSGYLVPAGILGWYKIPTQDGAFLQSHFSVVSAVRLGEICDFGATYIDARTYPALQDEDPNLMNDVVVIWQVPPIIPYDGIFVSQTMPVEMKDNLKKALDLIFATDDGKVLFKALFDIQGIVPVDDIFYTEFTRYVQSSGADWESLLH